MNVVRPLTGEEAERARCSPPRIELAIPHGVDGWSKAIAECASLMHDPGRLSKHKTPAEAIEALAVPR